MQLCVNTRVWHIVISIFLIGLTSATPDLHIRADFIETTGQLSDRFIQSYSSIVKFEDGAIPLDQTRMTDAKLINLAKVAYIQMVDIWKDRQLSSDALPRAMASIM